MTPSLSDNEIEDRYFLLGRMEILSVLNELIHRRTSVTVYFNGGRDYFLTTLLEARPEALVFDLGGDNDANRRLPYSPSCIFVAHMDGIRVQFSGARAHCFSWGGSDAFWTPLPERVVRVQRRESYRIELPVAQPLKVALYLEEDSKPVSWTAHDLSVGGLGFQVVGEPGFEPLQEIARLILPLPLPKKQAIDCKAVVRHVTPMGSRPDGARYRVGVSFSNLAPGVAVTIQRFIIRIEHERRSLIRKNSPRE